MSEFIEKNRATIIGIAIFLILSILYSKYQDIQTQNEFEEIARHEAETNLKIRQEQEEEKRQKAQKIINDEHEVYNNKVTNLKSSYQEIQYFLKNFNVDNLNFVNTGSSEFYLFDVSLFYNKVDKRIILRCNDEKGECIKYNYKDEDTNEMQVRTVTEFWYNNRTITEFEKVKLAFNNYKRLLKEIEILKKENPSYN